MFSFNQGLSDLNNNQTKPNGYELVYNVFIMCRYFDNLLQSLL